MTDLRAGGAADLRPPAGGATDLRAPGATDFLGAAGATDRRDAGGGATDFRETLAFADDLSLFLGMAGALPTPPSGRIGS
jgi:hypothetical protein